MLTAYQVCTQETARLQTKLRSVKNKNNLKVTLLIYSLFQTDFSNHLFSFYQYRMAQKRQGTTCNLAFGIGLVLQTQRS